VQAGNYIAPGVYLGLQQNSTGTGLGVQAEITPTSSSKAAPAPLPGGWDLRMSTSGKGTVRRYEEGIAENCHGMPVAVVIVAPARRGIRYHLGVSAIPVERRTSRANCS
jgi:hypothetical protein